MRIVQKATTNALVHGRAASVVISLDFNDTRLRLGVDDDGVACDREDGDAAGMHFGLVGMRERAGRIGATLAVERGADGGTAVTVT